MFCGIALFFLAAAPGAQTGRAVEWIREAREAIRQKDFQQVAAICERGMREQLDSDEIENVYLALPPEILAARFAERYRKAQNSTDVRELIALGRALSDVDPHRKTESPKLALELLAKAVRLAPEDPSAHFNYGRALRTAGSPEEMFAAWNRALALHPDDGLQVQIYTWTGKQRSAIGQAGRADEAFRKAHEINRKPALRQPRWTWEYFGFLKAQSREDDARALAEEVLTWRPGFVPAVLERARTSMAREAWPAAIRDADYVLRNAQGNAELERGAHAVLARAHHVLNHTSEAAQHEAWLAAHAK